MIFFKKNYAKNSNLHIEDYIPTSIYQSLLPKYQQFLDKLFDVPSPHLEKFLAKIQTNGVLVNREILEMMLDQLFIENQIPLQAFTLENAKSLAISNLTHASPMAFKFWIEILQELKVWKAIEIDETAMYHFFNIIDKMLSSNFIPEFTITEPKNSFWKKELAFPEITAFKFLYDQFKNFYCDDVVHAKRPMDLIELFSPFEDAALSQNLIRISNTHLDFLRALNGSALLMRAIQLFPAAMPDLMAFQLNQQDLLPIQTYPFMLEDSFPCFFGKHPHLENLNRLCFFNTWGLYLNYQMKFSKSSFKNIELHIDGHINDPAIHDQLIAHFQQLSKRLVFIFNRLTAHGYLMRSPILKGLGYHPLIHTELPTQFLEYLPIFYQQFKQYPDDLQKQLITTALYCQIFQPSMSSSSEETQMSIQKF